MAPRKPATEAEAPEAPDMPAPPPEPAAEAAPAPSGRLHVSCRMTAHDLGGRRHELNPGDEFPAVTWLAPGELERLLASGALVLKGG